MQNKIQNINQSSSIRNFVLTINNFEIRLESIIDMEVSWDEFVVKGYIKINDMYDIGNSLNLNSGTPLLLYIDDLYSEYYSREFITLNYNQVNEMNSKIIYIEFQDSLSYTLDNTYVSRAFGSSKLSDIINWSFTEYLDSKISGFPITKNIEDSTIQNSRILISTKSVLKFIQEEASKEGYVFYQTKKGIFFKDVKNIVPGKLEVIDKVYKESPSNQFYGFAVMDYRTINNETSTKNPSSKVIAYNPATKNMDSFSKNLSDVYGDVKTGTSGYNPQNSSGNTIKTQEYLTDNNLYMQTYLNFLNSNGIYVVVPGNVKYTDTFKIYDVMLKGSINSSNSLLEGDVKLSGKYISTKVTDKIIPGEKFIQKIKLNRVDNTKTD